jgi:hypothetical protein
LLIKATIEGCLQGDIDTAYDGVTELWELGYAASDIISSFFRVRPNTSRACLCFIRCAGVQGYLSIVFVCQRCASRTLTQNASPDSLQVVKNFDSPTMNEWHRLQFIKEIGNTHIKILDGLDTLIQLTALVARLARLGTKDKFDQ